MILATIGHRRSTRALRAEYGALIPYSLATVVAGLIGTLGYSGRRRLAPDVAISAAPLTETGTV
jgi:hypothetical protein